jgi:hypothetical protein
MADSNLIPLLTQYLVGVSNDLSAYGGDTSKGFQPTNINKVTNQNISSQNMLKLIQHALGPDESKVVLDSKGVKLDIPKGSNLYKSLTGDNEAAPAKTQTSNATTNNAPAKTNPFADLKGTDLAGLSVQDLVTAFGMKMEQDKIKNQSVAQTMDSIYKQKLMEEADVRIQNATPKYEIPGLGKVNATQYMDWMKLTNEKKPNEAKLYEYAINQGFKGSFMEFENRTQTTHKKDYDEAVKGGYRGDFNTWLLSMAKAGAINLSGKLEEVKAKSELKGQEYFNDPKWVDDIDKRVAAFNKDQAWLVPEKDRPIAAAKIKVKAIEDKILAGSGVIQNVAMDKDGRTMVWTVKWPSGDIKVIKHAVK